MRQSSLPTEEETLLLKACILQKEKAVSSWNEYINRVDLDQIDTASQRVLPLVYHHLSGAAGATKALQKAKSIYQYVWAENQINFQSLLMLLQMLQEKGIDCLMLKGAALLVDVYHNLGLRALGDLDLLVKENQVDRAWSLITNAGWREKFRKYAIFKKFSPLFAEFGEALIFTHEKNKDCDLHWKITLGQELCSCDYTQFFWENARRVLFRNQSILLPSKEALFFHVCQHGIDYNEMPSIRWIHDACYLLKSSEVFDWSRVQKMTAKTNQEGVMRWALGYLKDEFGALIPKEFIASLSGSTNLLKQRIAYRENRHVNGAELFWQWYKQSQTKGKNRFFSYLRYPFFLRRLFGYKSLWEMLIVSFRMVFQMYISTEKKKQKDCG